MIHPWSPAPLVSGVALWFRHIPPVAFILSAVFLFVDRRGCQYSALLEGHTWPVFLFAALFPSFELSAGGIGEVP